MAGIRTRRQRTKKLPQTMMAMMPPLLTREWSMHQCPKCCLQVPLLSVLLVDSLTLCRLAENEPPLLVIAACVQAAL